MTSETLIPQANNEHSLIFIIFTIILTAICSFAGTYYLNKIERDKDNKSLKQYLVDKISTSLDRLNILLNNLGNDPIQYGYFSLQNISAIKTVLSKLQPIIEDRIFLFRDRDFNYSVINVIDEITTIMAEIETMEYGPVNKYTEHSDTLKKTQGEYRSLKLQLFKMGFAIDENLEPKHIKTPSEENEEDQKNMLKEIKSLIEILDNNIKNSEKNLGENNAKAKEQRAFFAVNLLNTQSKIKDLIDKLKNFKV
jgi:predicted RNA-binding protein with EMAP domain